MKNLHVLLPVLGFMSAAGAGAQTSPCKPDDTSVSVVAAEIRRLMTPGDRVRDSLRIPLVSPSQVVIVTDTTVCARVRQALDSMILATTPDAINLGPRPIYTIRVGAFYAAINPGSQIGELIPVFFFNELFSYLSLLGF